MMRVGRLSGLLAWLCGEEVDGWRGFMAGRSCWFF